MLAVEDGSVVDGAESYASIAEFSLYCEKYGIDISDKTDAELEIALRKATDYIESAYSQKFKGERINSDQSLSFPRVGMVVHSYELSSNFVPDAVKKSCFELANKSFSSELFVDNDDATIKRERIDVIETEYEVGASSIRFTSIAAMLSPYLRSSGFSLNVSRGQ